MGIDLSSMLDRDERQQEKQIRASKEQKPQSARKLTKKERQVKEMAETTVLPEHYRTVWTEEELQELCKWLEPLEYVAIDTETMGVRPFQDPIVGLSFFAPKRGYYIPLRHVDESVNCLPLALVAKALKPLLESREKKWILHNTRFDQHVLYNWLGIELTPYFDTMIAQALLDENQSKRLKDMATLYLKIPSDTFSSLFGTITFDKVPIKLDPETRTGDLATFYATKDTELTYLMYEFQAKNMERPQLSDIRRLMFDVEMPFSEIVLQAERRGVALDKEYLEKTVAVQLNQELEELRQRIWSYIGKINLNSPQQVAPALYTKLRLPKVNKDKPLSTDKKTLSKLKGEHPVVGLLLEFRAKSKLVTAFAEKLPQSIVDGRLHTSFNSVGTKTGRMSSSNPNLQQIPAKVGGLIRNAFVADEGRLLASIDFSQQELRVLAHVSKDEALLKAYRTGMDIHSLTAVGMWNRKHPDHVVDYDEFEYCRNMAGLFQDADGKLDKGKLSNRDYIDRLFSEGRIRSTDSAALKESVGHGVDFEKTRKSAKVVNFGIIYGMSEKGLADTLEISEDEASLYIQGYFDAYPGVKKWIAEQRKLMKKQMYTTTLLGRKRRVYAEMRAPESWKQESGYRMGVNSIIQGSSADMVKLASIVLQPLLAELDAHITMWVHDELLFDVPESIGLENLQRIADVMCNALPLDCGLKSDIEVGRKWGQRMSEDVLTELALNEEEGEEE